MAFRLDPRLEADTVFARALPVCDVRLMDEARWPWAILVPRIDGAREWHDLPDPAAALAEVMAVSRRLAAWPNVQKVNIGALGNVVGQLHIHIVGRWYGDPAWPGPVWGHSPREPCGADALAELRDWLSRA